MRFRNLQVLFHLSSECCFTMFHQDVVETLLALAPEPMQLCGRVPAFGVWYISKNAVTDSNATNGIFILHGWLVFMVNVGKYTMGMIQQIKVNGFRTCMMIWIAYINECKYHLLVIHWLSPMCYAHTTHTHTILYINIFEYVLLD